MALRAPPVWIVLPSLTLLAGGVVVWTLVALDAPSEPLPGESYRGSPAPLSGEASALRDQLRVDVQSLVALGERSTRHPGQLELAAQQLEARLTELGLDPNPESYRVGSVSCRNIFVDVGRDGAESASEEQLLLGAHYDSAHGSPGANDNASGVAVLLAIAARFAETPPTSRSRIVFFVNEEPPHFRTSSMGSRVYAARAASAGRLPTRVVVLDSVGFYSSLAGSQRFPIESLTRRFGNRGDFVAFVSNRFSEPLLLALVGAFRRHAELPSRGGAFPDRLAGVAWSDHASFWEHGVAAVLVSDTATFRDPSYHESGDRGQQIDYDSLSRLTLGLESALREL